MPDDDMPEPVDPIAVMQEAQAPKHPDQDDSTQQVGSIQDLPIEVQQFA